MSNRPNGGSAFPVPGVNGNLCRGMTIRDYFAAHASDSDIRRWVEIYRHNGSPITEEEARYAYADAMLRAKNQP